MIATIAIRIPEGQAVSAFKRTGLYCLTAVLVAHQATSSRAAAVVDFHIDSLNGETGNPLILDVNGLSDNGVTFDARLTMVGNGNLEVAASGVGVGNSRVNAGETIDFLLSTFNVSGGSVNIDGFLSGILTNAADTIDRATFYRDAGRTTPYAMLNGTNLISFDEPRKSTLYLRGETGAGGTTSFGVDSISARFVGIPSRAASVPEPGSLALLGSLGLVTAGGCRRRRNSTIRR